MNDALHGYVAGTMSDADAAAFEDRLFAAPELADDAASLVAIGEALRSMAAESPLVPILRHEELEPFSKAHRVTMHTPVNNRCDTTIRSEEFVVVRLPVDLRAATRVDVRFCSVKGDPYFVVHDAPHDGDGVNVVCKSRVAAAQGALRVQVADQDERVLADLYLQNGPAP